MVKTAKSALQGKNFLNMPLLLLLSLVFSVLCLSSSFAAEKLQPFSASFTVLPTKSSSLFDIQVTLDIVIHNGEEGSLLGSKFVCTQDIDAISVTDGESHRLPYTLKSYPRKRIMWEYGPAKKGTRRALISFIIRNGVKKQGETCILEIDWAGGWNRDVLDATYTITLPASVTKKDIVSVMPGRYTFTSTSEGSRVIYHFPILDAKLLKLVYKDHTAFAGPAAAEQRTTSSSTVDLEQAEVAEKKDTAAQKPSPELQASSSRQDSGSVETSNPSESVITNKDAGDLIGGKYSITNIRFGPHGPGKDRLVFDLSRNIPYEFFYPEETDEVEVVWKVPVGFGKKALEKKRVNTSLIKAIRWKKSTDKKLSCIIQLKKKEVTVKYGSLDNPPRFYVDISGRPVQETAGIVQQIPAREPDNATQTAPPHLAEPPSLPVQSQQDTGLQPTQETVTDATSRLTTTIPAPVTDARSADKAATIEEKLAYQKARKLFEVREYANAIAAYENFLAKYPDTRLQEDILFDIADAQYNSVDLREPKNYNSAIQAFKKALANYPESPRAAYATFQIAECHRKGGFYIEASSQYDLVIQRYPKTPYTVESRYWLAECLFQMQKFEDALREFDKFVNDFPTGPHAREASFRIADCYAEIKDFERSEFYYEKALKRWPDLIDLPVSTLNNMAMTNYYKGKFEKSRELLFLSFNLYPVQNNRERLLRFAGDSYQWEGDMQKALNLYGLLIDLYPDTEESAMAVMRIADLGVNVAGLESEQFKFNNFNPYKNPEKAYQWITANAKTREVLTEGFYKLGFTLAKQGKLVEAVEYFKKSMSNRESGMYYAKSFENIQKILTRMIHTAVEKEDYFNVVEMYKRNESIFRKNIDDCMFFYEVAHSYLETGLITDSESMFNGILTHTDNPECRQKSIICLSRIDIVRGNVEKAQERLNILLYGGKVLDSVTDEAYHILGDAYFQDKKYKEALDAYAVPLKGKNIPTYRQAKTLLRIGECFGKTGYYYNGVHVLKKLLAMIDQIKQRRPEYASFKDEAGLMLGDYLFKKKNYTAAVKAYSELTQTALNDQTRSWAYVKWGETLMQKGDFDNATRVLLRFTEKMPYSFLNDVAQSQIKSMQWESKFKPELNNIM